MTETFRNFRDILKLNLGWFYFLATGRCTGFSHRAMIWLYCRTGGKSNIWQEKILSWLKPPYDISEATGVLGTMTKTQIDTIAMEVKQQGYSVMSKAVSQEICRKALEFAANFPAMIHPSDDETKIDPNVKPKIGIYKRGFPEGARYTYFIKDYMKEGIFQNLVTDPTFLAIANSYLGCKPQLDILGLWWLTKYSDTPEANAAQLYHFDMDRVSWIKFFIYFTDVNTETGPHCFIRKTHQPGRIPQQLLNHGYARLNDEDVLKYYPKEDIIEHLAAAGTVIAEDTRGLHKGKHVTHGDRLAMSIQYSSTMFGALHDVHWTVPKENISSDEISKRIKKHPRVYRNFFKL